MLMSVRNWVNYKFGEGGGSDFLMRWCNMPAPPPLSPISLLLFENYGVRRGHLAHWHGVCPIPPLLNSPLSSMHYPEM